LAMARLDTIIVNWDRGRTTRRPSAQSMAAAAEVGLKSVLSAPLYARGVLLGVMSLALSDLTDRTEQSYATADRYLIGAIASQVAVAIDNALAIRGRALDHVGPSSILPATS
jgi:GAF domain-containing protein